MALIVPEVYSEMTREKFLGRVMVAPHTMALGELKGQVGDTVHFPKFKTITDAKEIVKGSAMGVEELDQTDSTAKIKQIGKAIRVFDIDEVTAMGEQINEASNQQATVFARDLDKALINECVSNAVLKYQKDVTALDNNGVFEALALFGDEQDVEDFEGIFVHSLCLGKLYSLDGFVNANNVLSNVENGKITKGLCGYFRGIPIYLTDRAFDDVAKEPVVIMLKKNALAYMEKRAINIELEREAKLKATDIVGDYIYATKLINDKGVVVIKKTVATK